MKKLLAVVLSLAVAVTLVPLAYALNYNAFQYEDMGSYAKITGCNDFSSENIIIPSKIGSLTVKRIENSAFMNKSNIKYVSLPDTVEEIGQMAFYGCKNLESVSLGGSIKSIGAKAFNSCEKLRSINLRNTQTIGEYAFYGCSSLTDIFGSNLKVIGKNAFSSCVKLSYIDFGPALLYISDYAFSGCGSITELKFPNPLGYIGNSAFKGCTQLSNVVFGTGELKIASYAFENATSLKAIEIPDNVTEIGKYAFGLREPDGTTFSHDIVISCSVNSAAAVYCKTYGLKIDSPDAPQHQMLNGDVNGDGRVTTEDARILLRIAAGLEKKLTGDRLFYCDINSNGIIDIADVRLTLLAASRISA